jgi:hypothetical protein
MQFNGHVANQDIVSGISRSTGFNKSAEIQAITYYVNEANRVIWSWIFGAYGGWQYDDGNQANLPSATTALVNGQQKYTIPTDAITIRQVSYRDTTGNWHDIDPITLESIHATSNENEFMETPGYPRYYRVIANVINIYPAPNYDQTASLRVQFDRGSVEFTVGDSVKTPGFVSEFHGAVPVGASYFIACDRTLDNKNNLYERWKEYEKAIKAFYKARFVENNPNQKLISQADPLTFMH